MTDPIADFLTRVRNAIISRKARVDVPASNLKRRIAELLRDEGYILSLDERDDEGAPGSARMKRRVLMLTLRYDNRNRCAIQGLRRVSKPGQRVYVGKDDVPKVQSGMGVSVLTTSRGLMTDRAARKAGLGGELICEVW